MVQYSNQGAATGEFREINWYTVVVGLRVWCARLSSASCLSLVRLRVIVMPQLSQTIRCLWIVVSKVVNIVLPSTGKTTGTGCVTVACFFLGIVGDKVHCHCSQRAVLVWAIISATDLRCYLIKNELAYFTFWTCLGHAANIAEHIRPWVPRPQCTSWFHGILRWQPLDSGIWKSGKELGEY